MLTIEITENAIIEDEYRTYQILKKLTDYGLSTAIDDFGTGYASLSCLRKIPINILKIVLLCWIVILMRIMAVSSLRLS